ncbi:MAG: glutaredoxin [Candidatus Manganitrophus sp.]|nr:glutaredoxin [Candidatus Manganitrophus sp.]MDC4226167.1 glutaredoxin [Candidatus Manganitrophus sp.]WDT72594.1 MAG: glutaredoxin [Candidatus Manganitrophus sp.]WDT75179.1 MAG: glutaredoxin [Candidatus Manganitrophus sp.]WDT79949.1 MAG: glutaredoxin [Candidatus Manganitrophus sp.]
MNIAIYKKTGCPWAAAVAAFLKAQDIPFEERDITRNPDFKREVEEKSGQSKSPTLIIDGEVLPDASVEQVFEVLQKKK